jgi:TP901 family phage tail tape measure protein
LSRAFTIPSVFSAVDKFTAPIRAMGRHVDKFASKAQLAVARSERLFRKLTPTLSETTKQFFSFASAAAISAAIVSGIHFTARSLLDYETALASTQAVTGTTNEQFVAFRAQINQVAKDTKKSAVDVAKSFEVIGSAKPELLASAEALGAVTKASIILSKASRDDLETSAKNLTGVMNQFSLGADQANRTINVLSAGAKVGAASISSVGESMKNFGSVAAGANLSVEQAVAMVEVLGKFSVFGAEAGTKLRGSILKLQQAGVGYASGQFNINEALEEANKKIAKLKTAKERDLAITKMFGAENVSTGKTLLNNISLFEEYTKGVTETSTAYEMAKVNSDTLSVALSELSNTWINMIVTSDNATSSLNTFKTAIRFVTDNMDTIVSVGSKVLLFFVAWKALLIASNVALTAYNVAVKAFAIGAKIVTAAQWAWNYAMYANPIGIIVAAVVALIALIAVVVTKWNEWGSAVSIFMGPLGIVISMIQSFRRNWDMISESFKTGGILGGLKAIGKVLLDAILMPAQQLIGIIADFTGAEWAKNAVKNIDAFRANLGVNTTTDESGNPLPGKEAVSTKVAESENQKQQIELMKTYNSRLTIEDKTGRGKLDNDNPMISMPQLSTTLAF